MQKIEYVDSSEIQRRVGELLANSTMINIQDDRDGSGMWIVIHQTKPTILHTKMLEHWGERCEEFEQDCFACHAWAHFDKTGGILE
jgi:hypothetical protein